MSKILLSNIVDINKSTFKINNTHKYIYYLDTANITQNVISNIQKLYPQKDNIPSRAKRAVSNNTIIYSSVRPNLCHFGILSNIPSNMVVSTGFITIDVKNNNIDPYYLFYLITTKEKIDYITNIANTSVSSYPSITPEILGNMEIEIIDNIYEQKRIGTLLKTIDNKIKLNNKINDELEAMAKTMYDYWFLQFEFPNKEGKPYKSSGGKMVWNDELKREIPEGWINGHLKEYIKNQKAGDWGKENAINNYQKEVTCIRGADFSSITSFEKMDMPRRFILEKNSFKLLSVYDLLIEISGGSPIQSTGRICYINDAVLKRFSTKLITSNFCKAISLTDNNYFYWFYMLWKTLYINNVFFNYESKTTGIKNLLFDIMCEKYPICKPPIQIIRLYNQQVTPYFNKIQQNIIENQELISLRDFLLPLLMNGQVGFKEDKAEG